MINVSIVVSGKSSADHSRQKGGSVIHTRALFMKLGLFAWKGFSMRALCVVTSQQRDADASQGRNPSPGAAVPTAEVGRALSVLVFR